MAGAFKRTALGSALTVSEQLIRGREQRQLSLSVCARELGIQEKYISALEQSRYDLLPGEMYTKAWLRKYAFLLQLDASAILRAYQHEYALKKNLDASPKPQQKKIIQPFWHRITLRQIAFAIIIICVFSYLGYVLYQGIRPPMVTFTPPLKDFRTQENSIILKGLTEIGVTVKVNGQPINLSTDGTFLQEIILRDGLNTITIDAKKKHSRSFNQEVRIIKTIPTAMPLATTTITTGP